MSETNKKISEGLSEVCALLSDYASEEGKEDLALEFSKKADVFQKLSEIERGDVCDSSHD